MSEANEAVKTIWGAEPSEGEGNATEGDCFASYIYDYAHSIRSAERIFNSSRFTDFIMDNGTMKQLSIHFAGL